MVNNITGGPGIHVSGNGYSMPYINMGAPDAGRVRYNGASFEVYDGNGWRQLTTTFPQIGLDSEVQSVIQWVRNQMARDQQRQALARTSPAVADALAALEQAEQQLDIVMALVQKNTP